MLTTNGSIETMKHYGVIAMKNLTRISIAVLACTLTIGTASACTTPDSEPVEIPQFLRDALYTDAYKKEDVRKYYHFYAKSTDIKFRTTNDFRISCDMGMPLNPEGKNTSGGNYSLLCAGMMPARDKWGIPSTTPITAKKRFAPTAIDLNEELKPAYAGGDDTLPEAWEGLRVLPVGSKLYKPKMEKQQWDKDYGYDDKYNRSLVCVVPDQHRVGCMRSDNHGFWLDKEGTHAF